MWRKKLFEVYLSLLVCLILISCFEACHAENTRSLYIKYVFDASPIYPGDSFTLTIYVGNKWWEFVNYTEIRLFPSIEEYGIELKSLPRVPLGEISLNETKEVSFSFEVSEGMSQGVYPLEGVIEYFDDDYRFHRDYFNIPVVISSSDLRDRCDLFNLLIQDLQQKIPRVESKAWSNLIYASIILLAIFAGISLFLYLEIRQLKKKLRELRKIRKK